ncbi:hypothetical protein CEUSTIGMA_g765.t1 [Chlamydomonas eustigma]|uniref:Uncharacterized protein n=1 Tax=Chlamydomonas eustigma TaxID=1157962 RepID=A0A250WR89_9CHLO|nr:hypothetical protein CEUSTIGMA_g765.t1 [Chlamydomonas eustigma]|eukprot:GAX73311.1 hypothetical protein CEUSTIGMA_g765.t1 [Chlamydomonas eustigma]
MATGSEGEASNKICSTSGLQTVISNVNGNSHLPLMHHPARGEQQPTLHPTCTDAAQSYTSLNAACEGGRVVFAPGLGFVVAPVTISTLLYIPSQGFFGPGAGAVEHNGVQRFVELHGHDRPVQALAVDVVCGRVVSSSESGGTWGPRSNCDVAVWDLRAGGTMAARITVHREHALQDRRPLAICGTYVAVLTENYVMDLSRDSSTVVKLYNIDRSIQQHNLKAEYCGSVTKGGYNDLNSEYSVIKAVQLSERCVVLASDGSGFNPYTWYDVYDIKTLSHVHTFQQRFQANPLDIEISPAFTLLDGMLIAANRGGCEATCTVWDLTSGDQLSQLTCHKAHVINRNEPLHLQQDSSPETLTLTRMQNELTEAQLSVEAVTDKPSCSVAAFISDRQPLAVVYQPIQDRLDEEGDAGLNFGVPETLCSLQASLDGTYLSAVTSQGALLLVDLATPMTSGESCVLRRHFVSAVSIFDGSYPAITPTDVDSEREGLHQAWKPEEGQEHSKIDKLRYDQLDQNMWREVKAVLSDVWMWEETV